MLALPGELAPPPRGSPGSATGFPIQTSLSVAPELPDSLRLSEKCENFRKTSTPLLCPRNSNSCIKLELELSCLDDTLTADFVAS